MISYFGDFAEDDTVLIPFNTFDSNDPSASVTVTTLIASDIYVHKDGSVTDIVTDGATIAIDFDGITGNHLITIDTSAHADYSTGSEYAVRIEGATVDGATDGINAWVGAFSIERAGGVLALLKGATGLAAIDTVVDTINTNVGTAGAGLTDLGGMSTGMKAEVNAEADTAIETYGLDHLISAALPTNWATDVASGSVFDNIADDGTAVYDRTTDSLQAVRDHTPGQTDIVSNGAITTASGEVTTVTNLTNAPTSGDLTATMKTSVNTEVDNALNVTTYSEPGQEAPGVDVSLVTKIGYLYKAWRNRSNETATTYQLYADNTTTVDQKVTVSDDSTTFEKSEVGSGP